jgi:signal transduction histidine kinase
MDRPAARERISWRRGLQGRLLILTAAGMIASYLVAGAVSEVAIARSERRVVEERRLAAAALAAHLDAEIVDALAALQQVALEPHVDLTEGGVQTGAALRAAHRRIGWVEAVFVADARGRVVRAEPEMPAPAVVATLTAHIAAAVRSSRPVVSDLVPQSSGRGRIFLLVPVWRPGAPPEMTIGAIAEPDDRAFTILLAPIRRARQGGATILDRRGHEIASSVAVSQDSIGRGDPSESAVGAAGWRVRVAPAGTVSPAGPARWTIAWLAAAVFGGMLLFAWGAARSLKSPIAALTEAAGRIAGGDMDVTLPPSSDDEVGRLGVSFEVMRRALKHSLQEIATANRTLEQRVAQRTAELSRLNDELQLRERQRAALLARVIAAQEDERKRVAREIHDESCQLMVALDLRLSKAIADLPSGASRESIAAARTLVAHAQDALRRLMYDLRPAVLDDIGLVPAIRWCAERHLVAAGVKVRLELPEKFPRLPHEIETALFRAAQEVIINVERHAHADRALVQVRLDPGDCVVIEIEDDGEGFDPASAAPSPDGRGLGLLGLRERVDLVGGVTEIESAPGAGTRVVIRVPMPRSASEVPCPAFAS